MSLTFKIEIDVELTEGQECDSEMVLSALKETIEQDLGELYLDDEETSSYEVIGVRSIS